MDLAGGWLRVGESKTDAGRRRVKIRARSGMKLLRVRRSQAPDEFVFPTLTGGRQSADNFRSRVLRAAVKRADERLAEQGRPPLPDKLTPHSLRRTFCSLLYALGEDPGLVMDDRWQSVADERQSGPPSASTPRPPERRNRRLAGCFVRWARRVSNLRPLACEASALPLSYAPWTADCIGPAR